MILVNIICILLRLLLIVVFFMEAYKMCDNDEWIYESPDGKKVYRRKFMDYDKRELIN